MAYLFRLWMLGSGKAEDRRLRRIESIGGHRLAAVSPAVRVFSARARRPGPT